MDLRHDYDAIKDSWLNWVTLHPKPPVNGGPPLGGLVKVISSFYSRLVNLNIHRMEGAPDRQSVLDCALLSHFMHSLPPDAFDFVFDGNTKNGREVVNYAIEFVESRSYNRCSSGQRSQPNSGGGTDDLQVLPEVWRMHVTLIVLVPRVM